MCPGLLDQNTNLWVILAYFLAPGTIKIPSGKCSSISKYLWKYIHYFLVQGQNSLQTTILSEQTSGQEITNDCCTLDMLFNFFFNFPFLFPWILCVCVIEIFILLFNSWLFITSLFKKKLKHGIVCDFYFVSVDQRITLEKFYVVNCIEGVTHYLSRYSTNITSWDEVPNESKIVIYLTGALIALGSMCVQKKTTHWFRQILSHV